MSGALQRIIKDRDYHIRQIEENNIKIQRSKESIQSLEECNVKEQQLVEEYNRIIEILEKG